MRTRRGPASRSRLAPSSRTWTSTVVDIWSSFSIGPMSRQPAVAAGPRGESTMRRDGTEQLIGSSAVIAELSQEIDRIARSDAKVLVTGESGVGKELVASAIHERSARAH